MRYDDSITMGNLGAAELLMSAVVLVAYFGAVGVPAALIFRRIGRPWWFGVFAPIPGLNLALLWFVARWWRASRIGLGC